MSILRFRWWRGLAPALLVVFALALAGCERRVEEETLLCPPGAVVLPDGRGCADPGDTDRGETDAAVR